MSSNSSKKDKSLLGQFSVDILGISYRIMLYSEDYYSKMHPETAACLIKNPEPVAHFSTADLEKFTIFHETFHMYMNSIFAHSLSDLSAEDTEELSCDLFAYRYQMMIKTGNDIHKKLLSLRKRKNGK